MLALSDEFFYSGKMLVRSSPKPFVPFGSFSSLRFAFIDLQQWQWEVFGILLFIFYLSTLKEHFYVLEHYLSLFLCKMTMLLFHVI